MIYIQLILGSLEEPDGPGEVFISYKSTDDQEQKKMADDLYLQLVQEGFSVFKDEKGTIDPADELSEEISAGIANCDIFLCILSKEYYKPGWCLKELTDAVSKKKKLFCICWGDDEIPENFKLLLEDTVYHKYNPQADNPEKEFEDCVENLMKFIKSEFSYTL